MPFVQNLAVQPIRGRDPRRDQRLLLPRFHAVFHGHLLATANWSLSGLLLHGPTPDGLLPDAPVSGRLDDASGTGPESVPFAAYVVRLHVAPPGLALRFAEADARLIDFLEQCLRRRLAHGGDR